MRTQIAIASASLFLFAGCRGQQNTLGTTTPASAPDHFGSQADALFFSLERTPCFGKCRAYTVRIMGAGNAEYTGRSNVEMQGNWKGEVDHVTMEKLLKRAKDIGFFDMQNTYDGQVTDLPSTIIRINADGKDKKVVARYKIPPAFGPFAAFCDSLVATIKWTPVNDRQ